ncbi:MAG: GNAT family N-acetyltransferase [Armatimonadetes bacterium]|nr:GNAT family N-acetyltransferase [Armatimonadota bacterium]
MLRDYDPSRDRSAALRMWREVGWIGKESRDEVWLEFLEAGRGHVAELQGEPECLVVTMPATMRYLTEDLPAAAITGVTTGLVARKQGFAKRLTARAVAAEAAAGALVITLSMFEQGFYDQVGFGTGGYELTHSIDPAWLRVEGAFAVPRRLSCSDAPALHHGRLTRRRGHGGVNLLPLGATRAELTESSGFGLGYGDPELTHALWLSHDQAESGPYRVEWLFWREPGQLRELLALLASLGDQIRLVTLREPPGIQLQDLLKQPFQQQLARADSKYATRCTASALYQHRLLDLPGCLARTRLPGPSVEFQLRLTDPIAAYLPADAPWRGVGGDYRVKLGAESSAVPGHGSGQPLLEASVGAFTRLWLGAVSASGLALTDDLRGPEELLAALDVALRLPPPKPEWPY